MQSLAALALTAALELILLALVVNSQNLHLQMTLFGAMMIIAGTLPIFFKDE